MAQLYGACRAAGRRGCGFGLGCACAKEAGWLDYDSLRRRGRSEGAREKVPLATTEPVGGERGIVRATTSLWFRGSPRPSPTRRSPARRLPSGENRRDDQASRPGLDGAPLPGSRRRTRRAMLVPHVGVPASRVCHLHAEPRSEASRRSSWCICNGSEREHPRHQLLLPRFHGLSAGRWQDRRCHRGREDHAAEAHNAFPDECHRPVSSYAGVSPKDIDAVAVSIKPSKNWAAKVATACVTRRMPSPSSGRRTGPSGSLATPTSGMWYRSTWPQNGPKVYFVPHHAAHAAGSFLRRHTKAPPF